MVHGGIQYIKSTCMHTPLFRMYYGTITQIVRRKNGIPMVVRRNLGGRIALQKRPREVSPFIFIFLVEVAWNKKRPKGTFVSAVRCMHSCGCGSREKRTSLLLPRAT